LIVLATGTGLLTHKALLAQRLPEVPRDEPRIAARGVQIARPKPETAIRVHNYSDSLRQGAPKTRYALTTLFVPGSTQTVASAVNASDQVAGWYHEAQGDHGFLYSNGTYKTLDVPGATATVAHGINDSSQVVGSYRDAAGPHGFLYSSGKYTTIEGPDASGFHAYGINNLGQIVGLDGPLRRGFLLSGGTYTRMLPPDWRRGGVTPTKINDSGEVVGRYLVGGKLHGFIYSSKANAQALGAMGASTSGLLVSPLGHAPLFAACAAFPGRTNYTKLLVPGTDETQPYGINNLGQIVGFAEGHGFVFKKGVFTMLNVPSGAEFIGGCAINDAGHFVGVIRYPGEPNKSILATPVP
jgi:uncharacterized membrane protein